MRTIPEDEKVFLGGDFNGHIGRDAGNYNSVHGGFGLGARNESVENLLEFALAKDLVIANSIFRKKEEHLTTYKSSRHATQVDYFLVRKGDRPSCLDCKDEEENHREEGRVQGKDHVRETQRGYGHNPVKQNKFIGLPKSIRGCE
ncbi:uncharacterized protein LOC130808326 [Amaranthus tricolor]|uniref:uncharacterized protein LOC130808326 n=1 Tax=Amaranthus tricolor TaxID=29722 RepID=UPI00258715F0|nr:uncharacterized protein LOC130808326 [Amaranthus tricolor]